MIHRINRLRDRLHKQLELKEIDLEEVGNISEELDMLILEYYRNKENKGDD